jgi:hypothetical protein
MTGTARFLTSLSLAAMVGGVALFWSGSSPLNTQSSFVSSAAARVGRPLTPRSVAGVARRTTRRGVGVVGVGTTGAGYYGGGTVGLASHCTWVRGAYGRTARVCN